MNQQQSPLISALERLSRWLETNAPAIAQAFQPGLTRKQIEAQIQALPFRLPEEVCQFYQWRNGGAIEVTAEGHSYHQAIELLPIHRLLSLEEAIAEYTTFCQIYEDRVDDYYYLPLFADSANYYVAKGSIELKATAEIFRAGIFADELSLEFNCLADMMAAIVECLETGAYYTEDGNYLNWNNAREKQVWLRYQPQRAANVDRLLNHQVQHLSEQELQQACFDLAISQHPQALSFFAQKLEESQAEYQRFRVITDGDQTASTLAKKIEAIDSRVALFNSRWRLLQSIRMIDSIEAIRYLFDLFKSGSAELQRAIIAELNQNVGDRNVVYEAGQQDPEVIDRLRQILQQSPGNQDIEMLLGRLENRLT